MNHRLKSADSQFPALQKLVAYIAARISVCQVLTARTASGTRRPRALDRSWRRTPSRRTRRRAVRWCHRQRGARRGLPPRARAPREHDGFVQPRLLRTRRFEQPVQSGRIARRDKSTIAVERCGVYWACSYCLPGLERTVRAMVPLNPNELKRELFEASCVVPRQRASGTASTTRSTTGARSAYERIK